MPLADWDAYVAADANPKGVIPFAQGSTINNTTMLADQHYSHPGWVFQGTSSAVAHNKTTAGAMFDVPSATNKLLLSSVQISNHSEMTTILCDRLCSSYGFSTTTTGEQTTNLPTAALPRYTNGAGVQMGVSLWTATGSTVTTLTVKYTNQDGTGNRVSPAVAIGGSNFGASFRMTLLPFQAGDTGVRSIESVTIAASTGASTFNGLVLFKPLAFIVGAQNRPQQLVTPVSGNGQSLVEVDPNACLFWLTMHPAGQFNNQGLLKFVEA